MAEMDKAQVQERLLGFYKAVNEKLQNEAMIDDKGRIKVPTDLLSEALCLMAILANASGVLEDKPVLAVVKGGVVHD